jgi:hypothetical protein
MDISYSDDLFDACIREIEKEYQCLEHTLGWRFLGVPKRVLRTRVRLALISLHPGGDYEPQEHPRGSCEAGNWYTTESWAGAPRGGSRLQKQVRLLFAHIAKEIGYEDDSDNLITESLVANYIPFRSPSFKELPRQSESKEFSTRLWATVLPRARPKLIVCLGRDAQRAMQDLLPSALGLACTHRTDFETGWGSYTATLEEYRDGEEVVKLLALPHLSRFTIFTSQQCEELVKPIIASACSHL